MRSTAPFAGRCSATWDGLVVHWSGAVLPCSQLCSAECHDSLIVGELGETSLEEILAGRRLARLRQKHLEGALEGTCCAHCNKSETCNLYEGTDPSGERKERFRRLELAITDRCDMRCVMCLDPRAESLPGRPRGGFMPLDWILASIDTLERAQGPGQAGDLWLHWIGEPLLHPQIGAILDRVAAADGRVRLNLVTHGIHLVAPLRERLLTMRGHHVLSISMNALSEDVFRRVNGSTRRDRVMEHAEAFLELRRARGREADFTVMFTFVVLRENLDELPAWLEHWQERFLERGLVAELGVNGRGSHTTQLMLLAEVGRRESPAFFREALRRVAPERVEVSARREVLDAWVAASPEDPDRKARITSALEHLDPSSPEAATCEILEMMEVLLRLPAPAVRRCEAPILLSALLQRPASADASTRERLAWALGRLFADRQFRIDGEVWERLFRWVLGSPSSGSDPLTRFLAERIGAEVCEEEAWRLPADVNPNALPDPGDLSLFLMGLASACPERASLAVSGALSALEAGRKAPWWQIRALTRRLLSQPSLRRPWSAWREAEAIVEDEARQELRLSVLLLCEGKRFDSLLSRWLPDLLHPGSARARLLQGLAETLAARRAESPPRGSTCLREIRRWLSPPRLTGLDAAEALALFHVLMEIDAPTAREHVQGVLVEHVLPEASSLEPWQREQLASTLAALGRTSTPS